MALPEGKDRAFSTAFDCYSQLAETITRSRVQVTNAVVVTAVHF